ncbi:hypothetical protein EDEG_02052 [Edhazardia aedis USNM 41457]|uniref:Anaphase-promoting complex subunit 4 WD40 domain-containing protein n=1 Tax=Edhazardia aedis (strain USNM 41457) TaxID=1003232 RepID=J9D770_EDHAE|nr:hypothetical protein EDEG_02052 [Edhazardia aedis USNM 41457]|eukprot:EJW03621.1 hypothetical protein EDEG_02052 [Edhazardia aedis USNM 41457]
MKVKRFDDTIITSLNYNNDLFLSSFNGCVYQMDLNMEIINTYEFNEPILSTNRNDNNLVCTNDIGTIYITDISTKHQKTVNTNCGGIENISINDNLIMCGGWKKKITFVNNDKIVSEYNSPEKIYKTQFTSNFLLCASDTKVFAYDIREMVEPFYIFEHQNKIESMVFNNCDSYFIGMVDGKIRLEYFNGTNMESLYFNAHKLESENTYDLYPVTKLERNFFLYSSGSDGRIYQWNVEKRKKMKCLFSTDKPITNFVFVDGKLLVLTSESEKISDDEYCENTNITKINCGNIENYADIVIS